MKKIQKILLLVLGAICGVLGSAAVRQLLTPTALTTYLENECLPFVTLALSSAGAVLVPTLPLMRSAREALAKFGSATSTLESRENRNRNAAEQIALTNTELRDFKNEMRETLTEMNTLLRENANEQTRTTAELTRICRAGFCNQDELVQKGVAAQIAQSESEGCA